MKTQKTLRSWLALTSLTGLVAMGCGAESGSTESDPAASAEGTDPSETAEAPLNLAPQVELVGLGDVFSAFFVTQVHFAADLYLLPEGESPDSVGDAVGVEFDLIGGRAVTKLPEGGLNLSATGRYRVLVRVQPDDAGTSVEVSGAYSRPVVRGKADDEPTPTPAEPTPTPAEPTPTPAEPTPTPAEPTPTPAEPTPTPASPADNPSSDGADEPTPTPAEPMPAEPTPTPARAKPGAAEGTATEEIFVRSTRAFEFYAGTVDVTTDARTLVVTWDVRTWFRALLAQPLGIAGEDAAETPATEERQAGFFDQAADFRVIAR